MSMPNSSKRVQDAFYFLIGFFVGYLIFLLLTLNYRQVIQENIQSHLGRHVTESTAATTTTTTTNSSEKELYEHDLADKLYNEVRILCWVFTHPDNHRKKVPHVQNTWGKKCNKLLFMSIEADPQNPNVIALPVENGRKHLWKKTKLTMEYVYKNHLSDADWFMRADDDNFIIMENLRYMLYQFHWQTSLYIGCRFAVRAFPFTEEGYMAGGGQIFSKKAIIKFNEVAFKNNTFCNREDSEFDDVLIGTCLKNLAIFLDGRDELNQKRFFPIGPEEHLKKDPIGDYWYKNYLWRNVSQGGVDCCSDTFVERHYSKPEEMHMLNYLTYHVHPFGLQKNLTESLPRKLTIDEIVKLSDEKSFAPYYKEHKIDHHIDDDEKYKKIKK